MPASGCGTDNATWAHSGVYLPIPYNITTDVPRWSLDGCPETTFKLAMTDDPEAENMTKTGEDLCNCIEQVSDGKDPGLSHLFQYKIASATF